MYYIYIMIGIEEKKVQEGYARHGKLSPKVSIIKVKHKKFGGKPPVPPIASRLLYFIIKTKEPRFCSCDKKIYLWRKIYLTNPTNELNRELNILHDIQTLKQAAVLASQRGCIAVRDRQRQRHIGRFEVQGSGLGFRVYPVTCRPYYLHVQLGFRIQVSSQLSGTSVSQILVIRYISGLVQFLPSLVHT